VLGDIASNESADKLEDVILLDVSGERLNMCTRTVDLRVPWDAVALMPYCVVLMIVHSHKTRGLVQWQNDAAIGQQSTEVV
jgi:hypothetical protein